MGRLRISAFLLDGIQLWWEWIGPDLSQCQLTFLPADTTSCDAGKRQRSYCDVKGVLYAKERIFALSRTARAILDGSLRVKPLRVALFRRQEGG